MRAGAFHGSLAARRESCFSRNSWGKYPNQPVEGGRELSSQKGCRNCSVLEMNCIWVRREKELARWQKVRDKGGDSRGGELENPPQWGGHRTSKNRNPSAQFETASAPPGWLVSFAMRTALSGKGCILSAAEQEQHSYRTFWMNQPHREQAQGPSGGPCKNTSPWDLTDTLAKALDYTWANGSLGLLTQVSGAWGGAGPSVHLSYRRGLQGHEAVGGRGNPRSREPHHLRENGTQSGRMLFLM